MGVIVPFETERNFVFSLSITLYNLKKITKSSNILQIFIIIIIFYLKHEKEYINKSLSDCHKTSSNIRKIQKTIITTKVALKWNHFYEKITNEWTMSQRKKKYNCKRHYNWPIQSLYNKPFLITIFSTFHYFYHMQFFVQWN